MAGYIRKNEITAINYGKQAIIAVYKGIQIIWEAALRIWKQTQVWKSSENWKY